MSILAGHNMTIDSHCEAIVIGGSAGSTVIIQEILSGLPQGFPVPIVIVQHVHESDEGSFAEHLARTCQLQVMVPCDKHPIQKGWVYVAPANYHILLERSETIALSVDPKVNWSRPSIDVLFESAAHAYGQRLVAVILSGANADGAKGLETVKAHQGIVIVQSPDTAECSVMPLAAINACKPDHIRDAADISKILTELAVPRDQGSF